MAASRQPVPAAVHSVTGHPSTDSVAGLKLETLRTAAHRPRKLERQVRRDGEADRFAAHNGVGNRRLLWHGTNVAVVAAVRVVHSPGERRLLFKHPLRLLFVEYFKLVVTVPIM